ncbi:hypothetical protein TNCV_1759221 [Trichonephila clavipes]|nr:hypothetical protein TNCV_1759221 [Trichonephila clavipes]
MSSFAVLGEIVESLESSLWLAMSRAFLSSVVWSMMIDGVTSEVKRLSGGVTSSRRGAGCRLDGWPFCRCRSSCVKEGTSIGC